ncbi:rossman fold oxidoreductase [Hyaloraphidium curvatum]|nr:rossman fold oxidoreductase [Hyaloraphidium curvatum]
MSIPAPSGVAVISGASRGIGAALVRAVLRRHPGVEVLALARDPDAAYRAQAELPDDAVSRLTALPADVTDEASLARAAEEAERLYGRNSVRLLFNVAGVLAPEKSLQGVTADTLRHHFLANAFGPVLTAKHFAGRGLLYSAQPPREFADPEFVKHKGSVLASMSARTGSIGDNKLGGWYSYRASKAALNQLVATMQAELGRKNVLCVALHPGTVATDMSRNFSGGVKHRIFAPDEAAGMLLDVVAGLGKEDGGGFFDYKRERIPW